MFGASKLLPALDFIHRTSNQHQHHPGPSSHSLPLPLPLPGSPGQTAAVRSCLLGTGCGNVERIAQLGVNLDDREHSMHQLGGIRIKEQQKESATGMQPDTPSLDSCPSTFAQPSRCRSLRGGHA
ncbi:hypothetical protein H0G86_012901 [Trichoderma simmonsii]|uniref:Uncharacterized protein n=1 Tax=Trichoderma simmonsii TaxID=1491479 RepID=A0A8G0PLL7_9HYPO|nr:hypothetical protein H0G86_012901 [Trichoderma simmonsii]